MFYAITKKIIQGAVSFIIMVIAFGFAFFVISYDSEGDKFDNPGKSLLQIIVMILGEFEFNDLYQDSYKEDLLTLVFTMILLIGLIIFGSLIMANLIVAIIVSDVNMLAIAAKEQVLINKVCIFIYLLIIDKPELSQSPSQSQSQSPKSQSQNPERERGICVVSKISVAYLAFFLFLAWLEN